MAILAFFIFTYLASVRGRSSARSAFGGTMHINHRKTQGRSAEAERLNARNNQENTMAREIWIGGIGGISA